MFKADSLGRDCADSVQILAGLHGHASRLPEVPSNATLPGLSAGPHDQTLPVSEPVGADHSLPEFIRPSASYIPPTGGVFFGQVLQSPSLLQFLPTRATGDRLLEHYLVAVHPIARCVHRPSLQVQYMGFWDDVSRNYEPRASVQAIVFAAWLAAAVAMDEAIINRDFGHTKANFVENMKVGTEVALSKANFLRTTRVETLQAFVMYMVRWSL